ncbi:MAG: serine hydrolase [Candidatus Parcubacteria bacterium]|nr:serine hydrolase [Candidatus Parcubacteria bacterium]
MLVDIFLEFLIFSTLGSASFVANHYINLDNLANFSDLDIQSQQEQNAPDRMYTDYVDIVISAKSAIAVDVKSGKILYQKNTEEILPIASITKLMTALVFLDYNPGWQKEWSTTSSDRRNGGVIYLNTDEVITLDNLFKTALIVSDNDSAMALSRASGLSEDEFIRQMNIKAKSLGLLNTVFVDPTGLKSGNQSTVGDLAKLLNFALQNKELSRVTSTSYYEFEVSSLDKKRTVKLKNTDWLLKSYLNVLGGKTGSLESAGYCLAVKIKGEKNQEIVIVVLGSQSNSERFQDVKAISDWTFFNYQWR